MNIEELVATLAIAVCFVITLVFVGSCAVDNLRRYDVHRCYSQQKERPVEEVLKLCGPLK